MPKPHEVERAFEVFEFPLVICKECGGSGELHSSHAFTCYECNGKGYFWQGKKIPDNMVPNEEMTRLMVPCCHHAERALWKNAEEKLRTFREWETIARRGLEAQRVISGILTKMQKPQPE